MLFPHSEIKAKGKPDYTPLAEHLYYVSIAAQKFADFWNLDKETAFFGSILHDIGKANDIFQKGLLQKGKSEFPFRHEIASVFFLSLVKEELRQGVMEMIIAHHKSIKNDARQLGILDLENRFEDPFQLHLGNWGEWFPKALEILSFFGFSKKNISVEEAFNSYEFAVNYCKQKRLGWSRWKGLMIAADHFASALASKTEKKLENVFQTPNVGFYQKRKNVLYPLSLISAKSNKKHTIVTASTGAGKTDFLLRRCKSRIFYVLPFQASINAMYNRIKNELNNDNPRLDIRVLHGASSTIVEKEKIEERILQDKVGAAIKILTPHQLASIVFGIKGFESVLLDIENSDVILDEIHVYSDITKAIVLKLIEILVDRNCRIHIGTATMPTTLYKSIIDKLGRENVYEVKLSPSDLESFNRHIIHKIKTFEESFSVIEDALLNNEKVLLVCNKVSTAQQWFETIASKFPSTDALLIHSRFKRSDRKNLERKLIEKFNNSRKRCIAVSTQVVEVSLDINFDLLVTQTAPIDSLIQRFGRINRKRSKTLMGKYKPIFVIEPSKKDAIPYQYEILKKSFDVLPDGQLLKEIELQKKIDFVFSKIEDRIELNKDAVYQEGKWLIHYLRHKPKSILLQQLDIDNVTCITENDEEKYANADFDERQAYEIPIRFNAVAYKGFRQSEYGSNPFIIPDKAYSSKLGLQSKFLDSGNFDTKFI